MEWVALIIQVVAAIAGEIAKAIAAGDASVLDKPVRDLLPDPLKTTLAKKLAEEQAAQKFGARS